MLPAALSSCLGAAVKRVAWLLQLARLHHASINTGQCRLSLLYVGSGVRQVCPPGVGAPGRSDSSQITILKSAALAKVSGVKRQVWLEMCVWFQASPESSVDSESSEPSGFSRMAQNPNAITQTYRPELCACTAKVWQNGHHSWMAGVNYIHPS